VRVAAFVNHGFRAHLRRALHSSDSLFDSHFWPGLATVLANYAVDVAIVGPFATGWEDVDALAKVLESVPHTPTLILTEPGGVPPALMGKLNGPAAYQAFTMISDGHPASLRNELLRVQHRSMSVRMLAAISQPMAVLPPALQCAIREVFEHPGRFHAGGDLALYSGVPASRMFRRFLAAGLSPPKKMLIAAKLLRAHSYLTQSESSIKSVAESSGYDESRILRRHSCQVLHRTPSQLMRMPDVELIERLRSWLLLPIT